jgi:ribonuclease VapC
VFADASAIIAILNAEQDFAKLSAKLERGGKVLVSPIARLEAVLGLARALDSMPQDAEHAVSLFLQRLGIEEVSVTPEIGRVAVTAHVRFGKGRHRAKLNFGDCFAYACAKVHKVPLLCKGDDFIHTDIELA